jgi:hypothetical protein
MDPSTTAATAGAPTFPARLPISPELARLIGGPRAEIPPYEHIDIPKLLAEGDLEKIERAYQ